MTQEGLMLTISNHDFQRFTSFIKERYGLDLSRKQHLIAGRLSSTITTLGFSNFSDYVDYIISSRDQKEIENMLNRLTTNYTFFMRESSHFDYFRSTVLPYLEQTKKERVLSIWSAGCSYGQEPYTLSMILKDYFGSKTSSWDTRVLATDISQEALHFASRGEYDKDSLKDIPSNWMTKYFSPSTTPDMLMVKPEIRANVIFKTFNLMDPIQFRLKFDVIFCRNVMIYFDLPTKLSLVNRFYNASNTGGYLFIGHSESIGNSTPYRYLMPAVYRKL